MASTGTVWSGMIGLQTARFDVLEVGDPVLSQYINVVSALEDLEQQIGGLIAADDNRIQALEDKVQSLDEQKAATFVAVDPLPLGEGAIPNELSQTEGPTPAGATAVRFSGVGAYIEFSDGRTDVLDFTKDWSVGVTVLTHGAQCARHEPGLLRQRRSISQSQSAGSAFDRK